MLAKLRTIRVFRKTALKSERHMLIHVENDIKIEEELIRKGRKKQKQRNIPLC